MQHVKAQIQREVVKETAWAELAILNAASIHTLTRLGKNIGIVWDVTWPGLDRCQTNVFDDGAYCKRGQPERWFSDVSQVGVCRSTCRANRKPRRVWGILVPHHAVHMAVERVRLAGN